MFVDCGGGTRFPEENKHAKAEHANSMQKHPSWGWNPGHSWQDVTMQTTAPKCSYHN